MNDLEIARSVTPVPIGEIAAKLGLAPDHLDLFGRTKAKVHGDAFESRGDNADGKLILVTSINPTPAGEGKTTTAIGLADALNRIGRQAGLCLREPSLGPCFGMKGGATGGGYSQVVPMEDINLHFTGDFHAMTSAHNLLAALLDNHLHHGNALDIDVRRIRWRRVLDVNDRALRHIVVGLGGPANSLPHENGFDITVASEIMAIFCLSLSLEELKERLGRIVVAENRQGEAVTAADLKARGAMAVLLKEAMKPNLVQSLEGTPAFVHGGPFANIAHGCNSLLATRLSMKLSDYTVTEAGFGADLGAEKFLNIKCRKGNLRPDLAVVVATVRALKYHGGLDRSQWNTPDGAALARGMGNLEKHVENLRAFGLPVVIAINIFPDDSEEELRFLESHPPGDETPVVRCDHWARGGAGAKELACTVARLLEEQTTKPELRFSYPDEMPLWEKIDTVCRTVYGADGAVGDKKVMRQCLEIQDRYGRLPVCMAKTQYSLSTDPLLRGRPSGFTIPITGLRVAAGAGFIVVLTGDIMTMPGLPKMPAAEKIDLDSRGNIVGLF